jgi:hypothetical protein
MRLTGLALLLPLAACFSLNPAFVPPLEDTDSTTTTGSPGDSTDSDTPIISTTSTTTTSSTTITGSTTVTGPGTTIEPLTSTSEFVTSEPSTGSSSISGAGELDFPLDCTINKADQEPFPYVLDIVQRGKIIDVCDGPTTYKGSLKVDNGKLLMKRSNTCAAGEPDLLIGQTWPAFANPFYPCVEARVYWNKVDGECRIGALWVMNLQDDINEPAAPAILASLSYPPTPPPDFQLWPTLVKPPSEPCGCPGNTPCCDPFEPGEYTLDVDGEYLDSTLEATFPRFGKIYRFKNIQSYIGPGCQNGPGVDVHIDWFLERL